MPETFDVPRSFSPSFALHDFSSSLRNIYSPSLRLSHPPLVNHPSLVSHQSLLNRPQCLPSLTSHPILLGPKQARRQSMVVCYACTYSTAEFKFNPVDALNSVDAGHVLSCNVTFNRLKNSR